MTKQQLLCATAFAAGLAASTQQATAKVVKFEVVRIESAFEGRTFGSVGTYDRVVARATIAVAPDDPHNRVIVDIDHAPRNAQGLVEDVCAGGAGGGRHGLPAGDELTALRAVSCPPKRRRGMSKCTRFAALPSRSGAGTELA